MLPVHCTKRMSPILPCSFSTHPATTQIYTLSLHDALPIFQHALHGCRLEKTVGVQRRRREGGPRQIAERAAQPLVDGDRKSTRLNSSHGYISYAVFCLKKKKHSISVEPYAQQR